MDHSDISSTLCVEAAESALAAHGYKVNERDPTVRPDFPGAYMVIDPLDNDEGFALVGDCRDSLILEAHSHLLEDRDVPAVMPSKTSSKLMRNGRHKLILAGKEVGEAWRWPKPSVGRRPSGFGLLIHGIFWRKAEPNTRSGLTTMRVSTLKQALELADKVLSSVPALSTNE